MKTKHIFIFVLICAIQTVDAQSHLPFSSEAYFKRGVIKMGKQAGVSSGFSSRYAQVFTLFAKSDHSIEYFLADRLSLGLGYSIVSTNFSFAYYPVHFLNKEINLKYYFNPKSRFVFYGQIGLAHGQYTPTYGNDFYNVGGATSMIKMGMGVTYMISKVPGFAINAEINHFGKISDNLARGLSGQPFANIGLSYSFLPKKKKRVRIEP